MASTYLSKTFGSAGNRKTWTWSGWIKRSSGFSTQQTLLGTSSDVSTYHLFYINSDNGLTHNYNGTYISTNAKFRDTSAWYHFVCAVDTTQATASDRVKIYVNGSQITSFDVAGYPSQNTDMGINNNIQHDVGNSGAYYNHYFDGSMAHYHFIDGTAYDASAFGETDATTGIWKPKTAPSVTYGTNGFFLKFENSGAFGTDSSGNGNNFTVNGTMTQTIDTPSNVFATLNPLSPSLQTLTNGNTSLSQSGYASTIATLGFSSGKYYWEVKNTNQVSDTQCTGIINETALSGGLTGYSPGTNANGWGYFFQSNSDNGKSFHNNVTSSVYQTTSVNDIISIAVDADAGKIWWGVNGTWVNSGDPANGTNAQYTNVSTNQLLFPATDCRNGGTCSYNFGNGYFGTTAVSSAQNPDDGIGIFEYAVPTGYKALCTKSINAQEYA